MLESIPLKGRVNKFDKQSVRTQLNISLHADDEVSPKIGSTLMSDFVMPSMMKALIS